MILGVKEKLSLLSRKTQFYYFGKLFGNCLEIVWNRIWNRLEADWKLVRNSFRLRVTAWHR